MKSVLIAAICAVQLLAFPAFAQEAGTETPSAGQEAQEGARAAKAAFVITEETLEEGYKAFFLRNNPGIEPGDDIRVLTKDDSPQKLEWRVAHYFTVDPVVFRCWVPRPIRSVSAFLGTSCKRVHFSKGAQHYIESVQRRTQLRQK